MQDTGSVLWENKSLREQVNDLVSRIKIGIKDETDKSAQLIVYQFHDIINGCQKIHNEILCNKHINLNDYTIQQLRNLAKQFNLEENALNGTLLDALLRCKSNEVDNNGDVKEKKIPKNSYESKKMYEMIGVLVDITNNSWQAACCERIATAEEISGDTMDSLDSSLVQRATETELFSKAEMALKWQLAVKNYIDMRNDNEFKGSPFACAFSVSVASVVQVKGIVLKHKNGGDIDKRLNKYMKGIQPAIWQTIISAPLIFSCCYVGSSGNLTATLANTIGVYAFPWLINRCGYLVSHYSAKHKIGIINTARCECQILKEKYAELEIRLKAKCDGIHCKIPGFKEICGWIYERRSDPEWVRIMPNKQTNKNDNVMIKQKES